MRKVPENELAVYCKRRDRSNKKIIEAMLWFGRWDVSVGKMTNRLSLRIPCSRGHCFFVFLFFLESLSLEKYKSISDLSWNVHV